MRTQKGSDDSINVTFRIASFLALLSSVHKFLVLWLRAFQQQIFVYECAVVFSLHDSCYRRKSYVSCL